MTREGHVRLREGLGGEVPPVYSTVPFMSEGLVERTFGWFNRYRRLSKDYERTVESSEAWVKLAMINIMVHRLEPG